MVKSADERLIEVLEDIVNSPYESKTDKAVAKEEITKQREFIREREELERKSADIYEQMKHDGFDDMCEELGL
jgi:hypothetical protein